MKTILEPTTATIIEKKSKFIANLFYVTTKEEAEANLKAVQKQYFDARHHCYAYVVAQKTGMLEKASDDGEPSGTAGSPMLQLLKRNELQNVLIIVTRYFGGTLLGTGGLVRAYSQVTAKAIEMATIVEEKLGTKLQLTFSYAAFEPFSYYCRKNNIMIKNITYNHEIKCLIEVTFEEKEKIIKQIHEKTFNVLELEEKEEILIRKKIEK